MAKFVSIDSVIDYLKSLSLDGDINKNPYMDNALLNVRQLIEIDKYNQHLFDWIDVSGCDGCKWKNRKQKCSCCRRNRNMKDCYEEV